MALPSCPRAGHAECGVKRDGSYGKVGHKRQRYKCAGLEDATEAPDKAHVFVGTIPRKLTSSSMCDECDSAIETHQGPATARTFLYPVRQVAQALVAVGAGATYTAASQTARDASPVLPRDGKFFEVDGHLVADWVEVFGPVVTQGRAETSWPELVALDSTNFFVPDPLNPGVPPGILAFSVLCAVGYPAGRGSGRVWLVKASPRADADAWRKFMAELPGTPTFVLSDDVKSVRNAAWLQWRKAQWCLDEHHLWERVRKALDADKVGGPLHPKSASFRFCLQSPALWEKFKEDTVGFKHTEAWVKRNDTVVTKQLTTRHLRTIYGTGATESAIADLREVLERRAFTFRNLERMNRLLALNRERLNKHASADRYAVAIRDALLANGGAAPSKPRSIADAHGNYSLRA